MKKILSILVGAIMLISMMCISVYADNEISVYLDGSKVEFDVKPLIINERTMVPIRAIFEKMGATVEWNQSTSSAVCTKDDTVVKMTVNSTNMYVNNQKIEMDTTPIVIDGRTLAPARYVAEAFGSEVEWDQQNSAVIITSKIAVKYYYDATNEVNQIKDFISRGLYLEAIKVCEETLAWHDLSESDNSLISGLRNDAESRYNTYLYNEQNKKNTTTTSSSGNSYADGYYYRTPTGKRYHLDPDCGGKNSYRTTNISGLTPCAKCAK